jgi:hypothetical protein
MGEGKLPGTGELVPAVTFEGAEFPQVKNSARLTLEGVVSGDLAAR